VLTIAIKLNSKYNLYFGYLCLYGLYTEHKDHIMLRDLLTQKCEYKKI
jgi:hypothetical protein